MNYKKISLSTKIKDIREWYDNNELTIETIETIKDKADNDVLFEIKEKKLDDINLIGREFNTLMSIIVGKCIKKKVDWLGYKGFEKTGINRITNDCTMVFFNIKGAKPIEANKKIKKIEIEDMTLEEALEYISSNNNIISDYEEHDKAMKQGAADILKVIRDVDNGGILKYKGDKKEMENIKSIKEQLYDLIEQNIYQIVLTGAPGTGKTYMAKEIANELGSALNYKLDNDGNVIKDENDNDVTVKYEIVQFHPSYDYTDFVEGLRPVEIGNIVTFKKIDGIFKSFCRKVVKENIKENEGVEENAYKIGAKSVNNKSKYFFIIDEINRADLSKVLGELMLGLEKDKRGELIQTQYSNLKETSIYNEESSSYDSISGDKDEFAKGFFIPENVVIIGTMNDIDRSVESMDFALRRRFTWVEVDVTSDSLYEAFGINSEEKSKDNKFCEAIVDIEKRKLIIDRILSLNNEISNEEKYSKTKTKSIGDELGLNKHYYISQGYFTGLPEEIKDEEKLLEWVWNYRIESLLKEYIRGENNSDFIRECYDAFFGKKPKASDNIPNTVQGNN